MKKIILALFALGLAASAQTKSSATITQVVTASPAIAATVTLASTPNPSVVGKTITYSGTVTGTNNGASPTGTVTVVGITGSQTGYFKHLGRLYVLGDANSTDHRIQGNSDLQWRL